MSDLLSLSEEQRIKLLVSAITDYAIYMLDPEGNVATWNAGAHRFKGYTADEIIGEHYSRFFTPEDVAADLPSRALRAAVRDGRYEAEGRRLRKDGTQFWVNAVIDPIFDEAGKLIGFAKVTRDFTERKESERELEAAREALAQSQKLQALGELTGGIAHDFNNLMTVIAGASDFLLKNPDLSSDRQRRYLEAISETTDRATSLTDHLLAFGRRQALKPVVMDLGVRLDAFVEMVTRMLGSPIQVELDLQAKSALVEVDATHLETALLNAVLNARDAMGGAGALVIGTRDCEHDGKPAVCIEVRDTGSGISEDAMERVFEPFFTTKDVGKGTGLGLSQIHGFAAQAGGRAEIASREGEGTTLSIILPRTDKALADRPARDDDQPMPRGLKVLLVEDNNQVRDFAAEMLEDMHCKVVSTHEGAAALELARAESFDLIFSDIVMPGMSGLDFAERLAAERPDIPILLATGYSSQLLENEAERFKVVSKPYDVTTLSRAICEVLSAGQDKRG